MQPFLFNIAFNADVSNNIISLFIRYKRLKRLKAIDFTNSEYYIQDNI